ncbi:MAG: diaminobutyrate--2-oxoglutarate transaminase [Hyphomicrobiales bacterium]
MSTIYSDHESQVRSYARSFPADFVRASGSRMFARDGRSYLDFLAGCGSLNYGHNHAAIKSALLGYIAADGPAMGLDLQTEAKERFIRSMQDIILEPRGLDYRLQFTGPTGANAVEAAIKLARKKTGRTGVIAFTNAFHGCSLGALSLTGSGYHRASSIPLLNGVMRMPYEGYFGGDIDTSAMLDKMLDDPSSGIDKPAAIILELVQGEGGLNVASSTWLKRIAETARRHGALLIVDDIQAGCGRAGTFFSFEGSGVVPDIVVLAKSISGFGLPMALMLLRREIDIWGPGEHNGTFRGNSHAFVTAAAAFETFWADEQFAAGIARKAELLGEGLANLGAPYGFRVKGRGLMQGIDMGSGALCAAARKAAFEAGLIVEACGPDDEVLKLMPPLTVSEPELIEAFGILGQSLADATANEPGAAGAAHVASA